MILTIDTSKNEEIILSLNKINRIVKVNRDQAEKLLPEIKNFLQKNKVKLSDLTKIRVADQGIGFTSLRIGVATANALAFALGIQVESLEKKSIVKNKIRIVKPKYSKGARIGGK